MPGSLTQEEADLAHKRPPIYSPYAGRDFPTRPFFGDTHLHTSFSMDAGAFRRTARAGRRLSLCKGRRGHVRHRLPAQLSRPLDFLVVADHSDNMGFFPDLFAGANADLPGRPGKTVYDLVKSGKGGDANIAWGHAMTERIDPLKETRRLRVA